MSGKIVNCTHLDSVRVEVLGEGRAVTIPATLLLAADRVMRQTLVRGEPLTVEPVMDGDMEDEVIAEWEAWIERYAASGATPWEAVVKLAAAIESETR